MTGKIKEEVNNIKVDIKSMKAGSAGPLSSDASTGYGLGSGTFAQTPPFCCQVAKREGSTGWQRKMIVNLCFVHGTKMLTTVETFRNVWKVLEDTEVQRCCHLDTSKW